MRRSQLLGGTAAFQSSRTRMAWTAAGSLQAGMKVVTRDGRIAKVRAVESAPGLQTVHNFGVDGHHTYFVGQGAGVWVHNHYRVDVDSTAMARDPAFQRFVRDKYGIGAGETITTQQMSESVVEFLQRGTEGMSAREGTEKIRDNLTQHLDAVGDHARRNGYERFTGREASALAQNEAIIGIYASIGLQIPDFQWADLGVYVAQQVREGLVDLADGDIILDIVSDTDQTFDLTFDIQKTIVTDIAPLALGYDKFGAAAMRDTFARGTVAWEGFSLLQMANDAERMPVRGITGQRAQALRMHAAQKFGEHEQTRVQRIWDQMSGRGQLNRAAGIVGLGISTDIQVRGANTIGEIDAPGRFRGNTASRNYRIDIANNGFRWMFHNVHTNQNHTLEHRDNLRHFLRGEVRGN